MTQTSFTRSKTSLEDNAHVNVRESGASPVSGPFAFSRMDNQSVCHTRMQSSSSHWTNIEKERYSIFVSYFREFMKEENQGMRKWQIFKGMSRFVKSRNAQQCRSHHLKMVREFKGVSRFISMVMQRVPRLKEKMLMSEEELSQIQIQFNLYSGGQVWTNLYPIHQNKVYDEEEDIEVHQNVSNMGKTDKQEFIKTSDTYIQQRHPVNLNQFNQTSIFSSRSQFKPFPHLKNKTHKPSLPSFGDDPLPSNPLFQTPQSHCSPLNLLPSTSFLNQFPFNAQINQTQPIPQNLLPFSDDSQLSSQQQDKTIEKMKQFLECHYLFQLWTSKLEKIMRDQ